MNNSQFYVKLTVVHSNLLLPFSPFSRAPKWLWMCHKPPPGISSCWPCNGIARDARCEMREVIVGVVTVWQVTEWQEPLQPGFHSSTNYNTSQLKLDLKRALETHLDKPKWGAPETYFGGLKYGLEVYTSSLPPYLTHSPYLPTKAKSFLAKWWPRLLLFPDRWPS